MINPLNELSSVYVQNISEKKKKCDVKLPQGDSVDGGDTAKPGKDKNYVKPMATEGYDKPDEKLKTDRDGYRVPQKDADDAKARLLAKAKAKREAKMKENYSNWREEFELREVLADAGTYGGVDSDTNLQKDTPKTDKKSGERITEKKVKNKIKINPPQGVTEGFAEIGGEVVEMYEIGEETKDEKRKRELIAKTKEHDAKKAGRMAKEGIDIENSDMGEVIKDFRKSDAPQFKGKSKEKKREMAIAAKLATEEDDYKSKDKALGGKVKKFHKHLYNNIDKADKDGDVNEAVYGGAEAAEKKKKLADAKKGLPPGKGFQGKYDQFGREYDTNTGKLKEAALAGALSTMRAKNGMKDATGKKGRMSVQQQMDFMKKYRKDNPLPPYDPEARKRQRAAQIKAGAANQKPDTRSDAQKMHDATGPRPGSRFRGD